MRCRGDRRGRRSEERRGGRLQASGGTQHAVAMPRPREQNDVMGPEGLSAQSRAKATAGSSRAICHRKDLPCNWFRFVVFCLQMHESQITALGMVQPPIRQQ